MYRAVNLKVPRFRCLTSKVTCTERRTRSTVPNPRKGSILQLNEFKVLTFDCYGTLIDWETGMLAALEPLTRQLTSEISRDAILATHAEYESLQQPETPTKLYPDVLSSVYRRMAERWNLQVSDDECQQYGQSIKQWPAFPDSVDALAYLRQHYQLVILSNVDNASFAASNSKLGVVFDAIYTAEDIGNYKPHDDNLHFMIDKLAQAGINKSEILHTAESMFHDHEPANRHGLASCWIHRRHEQEGFGATKHMDQLPNYDFRFTSLGALAAAARDCQL
jgi:2-haloacid dehalogenase